ncbi:hypothetical protein CYMTET_41696 [Cymbomonas tetramitiformis]|uniref:histidinol-phosphatase n=1 Tax=Cymbomonas tetramitiformis TaxID=36881 RepID=A0AAE0C6X6_9CHLO|nr:hypothetical protein CYMTET_41696 [Cymbomonas tetramitiformis]
MSPSVAQLSFNGILAASRSKFRNLNAKKIGATPKKTRTTSASSCPQEYVDLAHDLADTAGKITSQYFRKPLDVESKSDASPVTIADRAAEEAMRSVINKRFPTHSVYGEEFGLDLRDSESVWVLDPIDGTKSFITGKPVFGTLVAFVEEGSPVLGVIDQPITKERWVGAAGRVTTLNNKEISTRTCGSLTNAYMYSTTPLMFSGDSLEAYQRLAEQVRIPLYGCDCYAYGLLSSGFCDVVAEADMKPYDYMALVPVVQGAGGVMTDWQGNPLKLNTTILTQQECTSSLAGEVLASGDAQTHAEALQALAWSN